MCAPSRPRYFTAGDPEVRAWTVQKGCKAPQAAGVIHKDFERGFIKAEVVSFEVRQSCRECAPLTCRPFSWLDPARSTVARPRASCGGECPVPVSWIIMDHAIRTRVHSFWKPS